MLHRVVEKIFLYRSLVSRLSAPAIAHAPAALTSLIRELDPERRRYDGRALYFGERYRSGFWLIYLLSAVALRPPNRSGGWRCNSAPARIFSCRA